ncbi:MAG: DUF1800 family protein [Verrucomicrobiota bacterium]
MHQLGLKSPISFLISTLLFLVTVVTPLSRGAGPVISSVSKQNDRLLVFVNIPAGFGNVVLEAGPAVVAPFSEPLVAGGLNGAEAIVSFSVPLAGDIRFMKIRAGAESTVPTSTYSGPAYFNAFYPNDVPLTDDQKAGHVLNRLGYGVSPDDLLLVRSLGAANYVEMQLSPETIDETARLRDQEAALFTVYQPSTEVPLIKPGDLWRYFKGTQAPPASWKELGFDDSSWLQGPSGFGYGDGDDATELTDMQQTATQPGYLTVFLRTTIQVNDPTVDRLSLFVDYDDGFVAYLNGVEVARDNVDGNGPAFNQPASAGHEAGSAVEFDLTAQKSLLRAGANVLAIQLHNAEVTSSDASMIPSLVGQKFLPIPPRKRINGLNELKQLVHVRGVGSKRQLQSALADFWDNHFTTDFDKVMEYFNALKNSDASDAMIDDEAIAEAAQAEFEEHQFFTEHALGNFGDLLLYSATSPTMLIYLDSVLNRKGTPNENFAREIMELFAFGVDNRYNQTDIEQLAKCFTGWTIRKVWPDDKQAFPASARTPPTAGSVQVQDTIFLDEGPGWKYMKGTAEPTPDASGAPTLGWTQAGFNDSGWLAGATSIGFGDDDDATVLSDMRNNYVSVYLRRAFSVADPAALESLLLSVDYDDGFVAYLNGVEIARSPSMRDTGTPPRFNKAASASHEALQGYEFFNLKSYIHLLHPAPQPNILAIQVHNITLDSSDLSIHPRLVLRELLPGSIENGDPNGTWTFRFNPDQHDLSAKDLFVGTPNEMHVPANRTGVDGLKDALEVIDAMVTHPSTREFICLKLINKFVSDQITLQSYRNGTAPEGLRQLMDDAMAAWMSTTPAGNIKTVLRAIFGPASQSNYFWTGSAYRSKIKTPVEFINSSLRAVKVDLRGVNLPLYNDRLGMSLFDRDMPDGWSELGFDWMDTGSLLERVKFVQRLSAKTDANWPWDLNALLANVQPKSAENIVAYFDQLLFQGELSPENRSLLVNFVLTDRSGNALALDPNRNDFASRVQELLGLMLSAPQWHNQ